MKRWYSTFVVLTAAMALVGSAIAQDAAKEKPAKAKSKARLPAHYAKVVDQEQREKIIEIRSGFAAKKEALQKQLDAIDAEEMAAVEAVLTPAQKQKLETIKAEAKAARDKKAAEKKADKAAGDKPAPKAEKKAA